VAFGAGSARTCGDAVRLVDAGVIVEVAFGSGVAAKLESVVGGGVATSGLVLFGVIMAALLFSLAGFASCEDMIAGSTGAPLTVDCPVGALLAGGVYLLLLLADDKGGKSFCRRTPLYLCEH
jgi:hypothetical protein